MEATIQFLAALIRCPERPQMTRRTLVKLGNHLQKIEISTFYEATATAYAM